MPPRRPLPHSNRPNLIGRQAETVLCFLQTYREEAMKKLTVLCTALAASVVCATPISLHWSPKATPSLAVDSADARVGRRSRQGVWQV